MINCTLIDDTGKVVFRQQQGQDMVWIDMYHENEMWKTLGMDESMAQSLKQHLLENTDLKEDPFNGVSVTYKT